MRANCLEQILRLGYSFFGALGVFGLFAAVVNSDWIRMQEPFPFDESMADVSTPGPGEAMGEYGPMGDPAQGGPIYMGGTPEELPEGMYPGEGDYPDYHPGTGMPPAMDLFFIKAHCGLWYVWYKLYVLDQTTSGRLIPCFTNPILL